MTTFYQANLAEKMSKLPEPTRQHCRLSICFHFCWAWQTLNQNQNQNQITIWWWDERACLLWRLQSVLSSLPHLHCFTFASLSLLSLSTDMSVFLLHVKNFPPMGPSDGTTSWKKNLDNGQLDQLMHIQYTRGELKKGLKVVNLFLHRFSAKKC